MTSALAPNSAIPQGLRRRQAFDASAATGHAAGVLYVAPDGDVLLLRRSPGEENFAGHWALPGGGVDDGETPELGAARESREEMGVEVDPKRFKVFDQTMTPTGKAFHTFAMPVEKKFWPKVNDEHVGAGWFPLSELPRPIHPAVEKSLQTKLGINADMTPEDWAGLREGFLRWTVEEEREPEHDVNGIQMTGDSALRIAMDRDSVREKRRDGQLVVHRTHITKANVCPYRGAEIPGWQALGLEENKVYNLLRDPDELRKGAATLNGVQLLRKHIPVSAQDHQPYDTVGSLGTDAEIVEVGGEIFLDNSLFVNAIDAIEGIESGRQKELSAGYHYKPDMTAGNFNGTAYDGIMRDIVFNHVALVEDGRAGPDVVVGDSMENLKMKSSRFAAVVLAATAANVAPLLAMDSKLTLPVDLFKGLTSKNFKEHKTKLLDGVRAAVDGKLRKGLALDASMAGLAKAIDAFEELEKENAIEDADLEEAAAVEPIAAVAAPDNPVAKSFDSEPMKAFLREKGMGEDDIAKVCEMMPKPAQDSEETDEEKAAREKKEADDKTAKDNEMKDMVSKPAMDAALKAQADTLTSDFQKQLKTVRDNERGVRTALSEVKPWVGDLPATMAFDSAADVYRHALVMREVANAKTLHADALLPILQSLPKAGARAPDQVSSAPQLAMDAIQKASKLAPGLERISTVL